MKFDKNWLHKLILKNKLVRSSTYLKGINFAGT